MTATTPSQTAIDSHPDQQWHSATWEDYLRLRDQEGRDRVKLAFNKGQLWIDMGGEGINHSGVSDLFTLMLGLWAIQHPEQVFSLLGRCLLEKPQTQACAPDLVLYVGEDYPQWQTGEPRRIDLTRSRVPNLVGEISDTTLANDLDEQKHLYAALGIPEYWVVDVQGQRVFAFLLQADGVYQACTESQALAGLSISLLEEALCRLSEGSNTRVAAWFGQQISGAESSAE